MKNKLIALIGLPTSGKNWAGRYINVHFGIPFYDAGFVRREARNIPPWKQIGNFDETILSNQLATDARIVSMSSISDCIFVEGWHIQNFVYALMRAPHLENQYREIIGKRLSEYEVHIFYFSRTPEEAVEHWPELSAEERIIGLNWFKKWLEVLAQMIKEYSIPMDTIYSDFPAEDVNLPKRLNFLLKELQCGLQ